MAIALQQIVESFSAEWCFKIRPDRMRLIENIKKLPADRVIWSSAVLGHLLANAETLGLDMQQFALETFVPKPLHSDIRNAFAHGQHFIFEEQLLGLARLAIEYGLPDQTEPLSVEQQKAYFWALALYGDLHSAEFKASGNDADDMAANVMRGFAFAHNDLWSNVLARAEYLWRELSELDEFKALPFAVDVAGEFAHATGVKLDAYLAAVLALLAHNRSSHEHVMDVPRNYAFDAEKWFEPSPNKDRAVEATKWLSGGRDVFHEAFAKMPSEPKYHGLAMLPFRRKPLYEMSDGRVCVVSERFLVEGVVDLVYWTVWEHLRDRHDGAHKKLEQLVGTLIERYVVDLVASAANVDGERRLYAEREAHPPTGAPDATVFYPQRTLCIEVTKQQLRYIPTLLAGDLDHLAQDLQRTADKVVQLRNAVARLVSGDVRFDGHDAAVIAANGVDRLVVLLDPIPRWPVLNDRLFAALQAVGAEPDAWIVAVNELEEALDAKNPGRIGLMLQLWRHSGEQWELGFHDFLARNGFLVRGDERVPLLRAANDRLRDRIRTELKLSDASEMRTLE